MIETGVITSHEYFLALERWGKYWGEEGKSIPDFGNFLGLSGGFQWEASHGVFKIRIRQPAYRKIKMLSGPHWYAFLKAYQARKQS